MNPKRRFHVLDALILTAFTAIGLAWCVTWKRELAAHPSWPAQVRVDAPSELGDPFAGGGRSHDLYFSAMTCFRYLTFLLVGWTAAFLILRLRSPRLKVRRLASYWGTSGCIAATAYLIVGSVDALSAWWSDFSGAQATNASEYGLAFRLNEAVKDFGGTAGAAIIAVWCVLALGHHLRLERSWLEYFGLLLCAGWLSILFEGLVVNLLWLV